MLFQENLNFNVNFESSKVFPNTNQERWFSPIDRTLRRDLKSKFGLNEYWFDTTSYKELIDLRIKYEEGYFKFLVTTAENAENASEKIKIIKFDLIVLDIMMPGKSGLEFLKENKKKLDTPVILLTAKGETNERLRG